jgi:hypothetical protein
MFRGEGNADAGIRCGESKQVEVVVGVWSFLVSGVVVTLEMQHFSRVRPVFSAQRLLHYDDNITIGNKII